MLKKEVKNEICGFLLLGVSLLLALIIYYYNPGASSAYTYPSSSAKNLVGLIGNYLGEVLVTAFGTLAYVIPAVTAVISIRYFRQDVPKRFWIKLIGLIDVQIAASALAALVWSEDPIVAGGFVGYFVTKNLIFLFGSTGTFIVTSMLIMLGLGISGEFLIAPVVKRVFEFLQEGVQNTIENARAFRQERSEEGSTPTKVDRKQPPKIKRSIEADIKQEFEKPGKKADRQSVKELLKKKLNRSAEEVKKPVSKPSITVWDVEKVNQRKIEAQAKKTGSAEEKDKASEIKVQKIKTHEGEYVFPQVDLLKQHVVVGSANSEEDLTNNSQILEETFGHFGIEAKVTEVEQGPVITRYELLLAPGVKVSSILSLEDNLSLALKATSLRIIAPIPGKAAIGIEVPNQSKSPVVLRDLIETSDYKNGKHRLPLLLGKDTSGRVLVTDLAEMPHILIAGTTGSGKTVCVNSLILGLVYKLSPEDLRFIIIDPKMVEMTGYNHLPHLLIPVVTDVKKASHALNWLVSEMENRYRLFASVGVRNIASYNEKMKDHEPENSEKSSEEEIDNNDPPKKLHYIVIVIDELADLMMVAQDKVEGAITRLAQLARAAGIHIVLATQRPSVDVITGVIKANFPARVAFKVASKVDSRTVLDINGAEALIGKGDMLFMEPGKENAVRAQACLVTDQEINNVVKFIKNQRKPEFVSDVEDAINKKPSVENNVDKDELFDDAVKVILETNQASVSMLQRRMRLGYTRAARIIDQMEAEGIVGPYQGSKPREILIQKPAQEQEGEVV